MRKRSIVLTVIVACLLILLVIFTRKKDDKNVCSRYEYSVLLCNEFGLEGATEEETPYFDDVEKDNNYYDYVQTLGKWEVEKSPSFLGEEPVAKKYVVDTCFRALGADSIGAYLGVESDEVTNRQLERLASQFGILKWWNKNDYCTEAEITELFHQCTAAYLQLKENEEYIEISRPSNVQELTLDDIEWYEMENETIKLSGVDTLNDGDVIIFKTAGKSVARKVASTVGENEYHLEEPALDEVIYSAKIKESCLVDFSEAYYSGFNMQTHHAVVMPVALKEKRETSKQDKSLNGFTISLSENEVKITVGENIICSYESDKTFTEEGKEARLEVENFRINTDFVYENGVVKKAEFSCTSDLKSSGEISISGEEIIPLLPQGLVVPIAGGVLNATINPVLLISGDATIGVEFMCKIGSGVNYNSDKGFKNYKFCQKKSMEAYGNVSASLGVGPQFVIDIFGIQDLMNLEMIAQKSLEGQAHIRTDRSVCVDMELGKSEFHIMVNQDDDVDSLIPLSSDVTIPIKNEALSLHYEWKNGKYKRVQKCTYRGDAEEIVVEKKKKDKDAAKEEKKPQSPKLYKPTMVITDIMCIDASKGEYVVQGDLYQIDHISADTIDKLSVGDSVDLLVGTCTVTEVGKKIRPGMSTPELNVHLHNETNGADYIVYGGVYALTGDDGETYYDLHDLHESGGPTFVMVEEGATFKFSTNAKIGMMKDYTGLGILYPQVDWSSEFDISTQTIDPLALSWEIYVGDPKAVCDLHIDDWSAFSPFSVQFDENNEITYIEEQYRP